MSRFVDLINKKFTGEQRKEDIPILYYDDGDSGVSTGDLIILWESRMYVK